MFVKTSTGFGTPAKGSVPNKDYSNYNVETGSSTGIVETTVGATIHDIALMKQAIDEVTTDEDGNAKYIVAIKGAGGIRDRETALKAMAVAGCLRYDKETESYQLRENYKQLFRIGASATANIVSNR